MITVFLVVWFGAIGAGEPVAAFEIGKGGQAGIECMAAKKALELKNANVPGIVYECKVVQDEEV